MKILLLVLAGAVASAQSAPTLKSILLEQLRSTHDKEEWFVPAREAVKGLTAEQASWKDKSGNHSVGQIANHLIFWNEQQLAKFKGQKPAAFNGNNDETFNSFDAKSWNETVAKLESVLSELEKVVEAADDAKLKNWSSAIAHIGAHNAYHIGQIVYVRRAQGAWKR